MRKWLESSWGAPTSDHYCCHSILKATRNDKHQKKKKKKERKSISFAFLFSFQVSYLSSPPVHCSIAINKSINHPRMSTWWIGKCIFQEKILREKKRNGRNWFLTFLNLVRHQTKKVSKVWTQIKVRTFNNLHK